MGPAPSTTKCRDEFMCDLSSTPQDDGTVARVAIALAYRVVKSGLRHAESRRRIHAAKIIASGEGFQLVGGEGRLATEQCVQFQEEMEQSIGNMHDPGVQSLHAFDCSNDVHVVDARVADDVENSTLRFA